MSTKWLNPGLFLNMKKNTVTEVTLFTSQCVAAISKKPSDAAHVRKFEAAYLAAKRCEINCTNRKYGLWDFISHLKRQ